MVTPLIEVHDDAGALATAVAGELLSRLADAQRDGAQPHVALTGGTIAERIHAEVARLSPGSEVDWTRVHVWWGDERFVDPGLRRSATPPGPGPRSWTRSGCRPTGCTRWPPPRTRRAPRRALRRTPQRCTSMARVSSTS